MKNLKNLGSVLGKNEQKKITGGHITWGYQIDQFICEENGGIWDGSTCCFPPSLPGFYDGTECGGRRRG